MSFSPAQQGAIQANIVYFLMDVPFLVADGIDDAAEVATHFGVDRRQRGTTEGAQRRSALSRDGEADSP